MNDLGGRFRGGRIFDFVRWLFVPEIRFAKGSGEYNELIVSFVVGFARKGPATVGSKEKFQILSHVMHQLVFFYPKVNVVNVELALQ